MATVESLTAEELIAKLYTIDGKAEIVRGGIIEMSPSGYTHGRAASAIFSSLLEYERKVGSGKAIPDNVGFLSDLPNRKSFSPDAAYYTGPTSGMKFLPQPPDFAIEVRSEGDYGAAAEKAMAAKRADYFAAGTKVVWDVDLLSDDVIRVYRANKPIEPTIYNKGDRAEAEPAVPGWTMPVNDLFE